MEWYWIAGIVLLAAAIAGFVVMKALRGFNKNRRRY